MVDIWDARGHFERDRDDPFFVFPRSHKHFSFADADHPCSPSLDEACSGAPTFSGPTLVNQFATLRFGFAVLTRIIHSECRPSSNPLILLSGVFATNLWIFVQRNHQLGRLAGFGSRRYRSIHDPG